MGDMFEGFDLKTHRAPSLDEQWHDAFLRDDGVIDPDQPTPVSDWFYRKQMSAPFTPRERILIRELLLGSP